MDAKVRHEDAKKGLHDVRSFIGACNFYRRPIKNFTYTSTIMTDLIKKTPTWRWGPQEQAEGRSTRWGRAVCGL